MHSLSLQTLTICGIEELPIQQAREVTHVLSVLDPDLPEIQAFANFGEHHRMTLRFHDIIDPEEGKVLPTSEHVAEILRFGSELASTRGDRTKGHLLVHCHMGISRSTAAMLSLLAQNNPQEAEERLFARLRDIRPRAWPNSLMVIYADQLLGRDGRLVEALRKHYGHQVKHVPQFVDWMTSLGRTRELEMAV